MDNQNHTPEKFSENKRPESSSSNKLMASIFLTFLVTALVVGGGIFAWQNEKLSQVREEKDNEIQKLQEEVATLEEKIGTLEDELVSSDEGDDDEDIPADWETYRSEDFGFSISYPGTWEALSTSSERMGTNFLFSLRRDKKDSVEDSLQFKLSIYEDKNMAQNEVLQKEAIETEKKNIASEFTKITTFSDEFQGAGPGVTFKLTGQYTWLEKNDSDFLLEGKVAGDMSDWSKKKETFNKMLSTFEVIE